MELNEYFELIDKTEIERFISDKQEEHITLEFKTVNHPNYTDSNREFDKKHLSEGISGFANSGGGIIIWGVKASNNNHNQDVAKELKPIEQLTKFLNLLNRNEGTCVTPKVIGIKHSKIEISDDCGFIKTYVPKSENAPHMANFSGKHYFKRSGDSFYQCEHYDIMDMASRNKYPKLDLLVGIQRRELQYNGMMRWKILISIENKGAMAKFPYVGLNISRPFQEYEFGMDGNRNPGIPSVKNNINYQYNYSGGNNIVIYPDAIIDINFFHSDTHPKSEPENLKVEYLVTAENSEVIKGEFIITTEDFLAAFP